jgi:hypothetical protein
MSKVKVNHKTKTVVLNAEARLALKRSGPSNARIQRILLGNDQRDMPTSEEARWLGAAVLFYTGYSFDPPIKLKQKTVKVCCATHRAFGGNCK